MADMVQVAANVRFSANARFDQVVAGAAIAIGQPLWRDSSAGNQWKPCDADLSQNAARCEAVAASAASAANQPLLIVRNDPGMTVGFATVAGTAYFASVTAGTFADAKPASGFWSCFLGIGKAGNLLAFEPVFAVDPVP